MTESVYAKPIEVTDPRSPECAFYHVMDIPGYGTFGGEWDLRETVDAYLGNVDFKGKRVLEMGTASGFLCFHMERQGATMVAHDRSPNDPVDYLLDPGQSEEELKKALREGTARANKAFWFCHRVLESKAKLVHGTAYTVPDGIGDFDIVTFCSILVHLRDPLLALQLGAARCKDTIIVTDKAPTCAASGPIAQLYKMADREKRPWGTRNWFLLSPELVITMLEMLGFNHFEVTTNKHRNVRAGWDAELYTLVARR